MGGRMGGGRGGGRGQKRRRSRSVSPPREAPVPAPAPAPAPVPAPTPAPALIISQYILRHRQLNAGLFEGWLPAEQRSNERMRASCQSNPTGLPFQTRGSRCRTSCGHARSRGGTPPRLLFPPPPQPRLEGRCHVTERYLDGESTEFQLQNVLVSLLTEAPAMPANMLLPLDARSNFANAPLTPCLPHNDASLVVTV